MPHDRITADPLVCHGQPCIKGTRIMAWLVLDCLANGDTIEDLLAAYPQIVREDILACLAFAAESTRENIVPIEIPA